MAIYLMPTQVFKVPKIDLYNYNVLKLKFPPRNCIHCSWIFKTVCYILMFWPTHPGTGLWECTCTWCVYCILYHNSLSRVCRWWCSFLLASNSTNYFSSLFTITCIRVSLGHSLGTTKEKENWKGVDYTHVTVHVIQHWKHYN